MFPFMKTQSLIPHGFGLLLSFLATLLLVFCFWPASVAHDPEFLVFVNTLLLLTFLLTIVMIYDMQRKPKKRTLNSVRPIIETRPTSQEQEALDRRRIWEEEEWRDACHALNIPIWLN
jgi:hypothetical protein